MLVNFSKWGGDLILTDDEVAMFYAIFTCAERVDWSCYEAFRRAILVQGPEQTRAAQLAPALNDAGSPGHPDTPALNHEGDSSHLYQVPLPYRVLRGADRANLFSGLSESAL